MGGYMFMLSNISLIKSNYYNWFSCVLLVFANLVVSNSTSSDDADATNAAAEIATSDAPPVDASMSSSEPAKVEEGLKNYSQFEDTSFTNAGELEDLIAAALDPDEDIDFWMSDYVGLSLEIRSTPPGTPYYLELQKELEEDLARWKREDYIFSHLRRLFLQGDHDHQNI
ncbi:hypothetical protein TorRG33x02_285430 [Trema orientale]|uniref:Uncharacterized protein n=1 Tax=Trema orientale TaxID=63057 RepID=A0A2P5CGN8_TREOI|nr:hypothetical protein TorRG33x02_285430 [Trema orientale]